MTTAVKRSIPDDCCWEQSLPHSGNELFNCVERRIKEWKESYGVNKFCSNYTRVVLNLLSSQPFNERVKELLITANIQDKDIGDPPRLPMLGFEHAHTCLDYQVQPPKYDMERDEYVFVAPKYLRLMSGKKTTICLGFAPVIPGGMWIRFAITGLIDGPRRKYLHVIRDKSDMNEARIEIEVKGDDPVDFNMNEPFAIGKFVKEE